MPTDDQDTVTPSVMPPYISFRTTLNLADRLKETGVPNRIDRSVLAYLSGGYASQVIAALETLRLIDDAGKPQARLIKLVDDLENRPSLIDSILRETYPSLFTKDLSRITPGELSEAFGGMSMGTETKRKAIAFFVHAAAFANISLSPLVAGKSKSASSRVPGVTRKASRRKSPGQGERNNEVESQRQPRDSGSSKVLTLKSGGSVTLSISVDPIALSKADRDFVFKLIDELNEYEEAGKQLPLALPSGRQATG